MNQKFIFLNICSYLNCKTYLSWHKWLKSIPNKETIYVDQQIQQIFTCPHPTKEMKIKIYTQWNIPQKSIKYLLTMRL